MAATRCRVEEIFRRLAAASIQVLPVLEISTHFVFERDGFICLVERRDDLDRPFGAMGAPGALTPKGMAMLIWRGPTAFFVAKGYEQAATAGQVEALRRFTNDLRDALSAS